MIAGALVVIIWGTAVIGSLAIWFFGARAYAGSAPQQNVETKLLSGVVQICAITSAIALIYADWPSSQRFPEAIFWAVVWLTIWPVASPLYALYICIAYPLLIAPAIVAALLASLAALHVGSVRRKRISRCWPFAFVGVFAAGFILAGEYEFRTQIQNRAASLGADCVDALPFWGALRNAGDSRRLHAAARKAGAIYAWSFSKGDFYPLPEEIASYLRPPHGSVGTFPSCLLKM